MNGKETGNLKRFCEDNPEKIDIAGKILYLAGFDDRVIDFVTGGAWEKYKKLIGKKIPLPGIKEVSKNACGK